MNRLLRITVFSGFILLVLLSALFGGIYFSARADISGEDDSRFFRLLRDYDFRYRRIIDAGTHTVLRQELNNLDNELDRLEHYTEGVETWLSILKRRRQLVSLDSHYLNNYRQSSRRAALAFPHSEPIAAIVAAALIHEAAITREGRDELREILPLLDDSRFASMRLSLHVLLGDFRNPNIAALYVPLDSGYFSGLTLPDSIHASLAIMRILTGDSDVTAVIENTFAQSDSPALIRLAAEYLYDFGSPLHSARLFSMLPDEAALNRQADALWLAGYTDNARMVWAMQPEQSNALYNLALSAETPEESQELFGHLAAQDLTDTSRHYGLIRYSRFFNAVQAISILENNGVNTLVDLEILKRRTEITEAARVIAETWMLLDRYPQAEELFQWGAWYFDFQRSHEETAILLRNASRQDFTGQWLDLHNALHQIRGGDLDGAEETLAAIAGTDGNWIAAANLARVLEERRETRQALEHYQKAAAAAIGQGAVNTASRIHVRIARCLRMLGRPDESRRALQYALELNPDNLNARLELSR